MTIVIVCDVLGRENNGTTIAAMNLIKALKNKEHTVRVVCPDKNKTNIDGYYIIPTYNLLIFNGYVEKNGVSIARPKKTVLEDAFDGADLIHVLIPFSAGKAAVKYAKMHNIPVTASFHCQAENLSSHLFMMNCHFINHMIYKVFYRNVYRYCDAVHYPTQFICDTFEHEIKRTTNHYVISNGVHDVFKYENEDKPEKWRDKFVILFTGRYSKEKSHTVLIDGIAKSEYKNKIQLVFAGDGPRKEKIKKYAEEKLPIQPVMKFFSRDELLKIIHCADLYVHPAEIEIEAIACLEAICCGKVPVIADSPRSATRYFALDEMNLFKYNDAGDLAKKIDYWIENPEERMKRSNEYLGFADKFSHNLCMNKMEEMMIETFKRKYETEKDNIL